ncbi:MAG: nucleotide pyrophosphohydrolase [Bacteroidales bacterium]|uniref:nucleotide pyrophosphohydrolase n=1 Tax=Porphyromonas sp. TaxID=1924944 RepID=UPI002972EF91|nr:nucleotide pyrophosphohydrolase [Porphyromonas sp.]MDD7437795.1 nucleotide pyrophosphohydrolase [Bacteroidales bacterium]MDY3067302.1 nucleotide pyrophosphohydrolase [Porphyromonas sp.]
MNSPTIAEVQSIVDRWINTYGVRYFDPLTNMAILTEEVGEVARVMARLYGEQSPKPGEEMNRERLADELADILWVVTCIANQTGCNLSEAFQKNIEKKTSRDKDRHTDNYKLNK